jgi:hypothetical protein
VDARLKSPGEQGRKKQEARSRKQEARSKKQDVKRAVGDLRLGGVVP